MTQPFDAAVIGAGAAGMMCAAVAAQRGRRVVLLDHATKLAEKIRVSGGGRCNFTNLHAGPQHFLSDNPHFCKSALSRYTPQDFLALVKRHRIAHHEKHRGQLFCDESSEQIIRMLQQECGAGGVAWRMPCKVEAVAREAEHGFRIDTDSGPLRARQLVVATGGLSIPKIGATDFGHRIARQFGLKVVEPRPGLVPLTFDPGQWQAWAGLAGISLEAELRAVPPGALAAKAAAKAGAKTGLFREDLLFTHRGLSGPAVLQVSSFWRPGAALELNLLPDTDVAGTLLAAKAGGGKNIGNTLAQWLPSRLADTVLAAQGIRPDARPADLRDQQLRLLGQAINHWNIVPDGSEGYRKAEVTLGGVDTRELEQGGMMARKVPGLHFIGETVDVTGWLGGYNFQWAWASAVAAGMAL